MSARTRTIAAVLAIAGLAAALRLVWLTADPPSDRPVGIVWHDEGAWVHNARNKALWGNWRTDAWNPVFVTPVFTGLEYAAFRAFGVGTWQARVVPAASGLVAIAALGLGIAAVCGRGAGLAAAALLATNFFFVMWNRAALMESTMTAAMVAAWAAYAGAHAGRRTWGLAAGTAAIAAFFTKAAAAFFVAALVLDATTILALAAAPGLRRRLRMPAPDGQARAAARWTLAGVAAASVIALAVFVLPWWTEVRFYVWETSVTRKPDYTIRALIDRASWIPVLHDVFTRMWPVVVAAMVALVAIVGRWREASPPTRLLALWIVLGFAELVVHDSGNERRFVMLVPALIGLAVWLATRRPPPAEAHVEALPRWLVAPAVLCAAYVVVGSLLRLWDLPRIEAGQLAWIVRTSAAVAAGATVVWLAASRRLRPPLIPVRLARRLSLAGFVLVVAGDVGQYVDWARSRTDYNYRASQRIGALVSAGTLVHGKLANGLALENHIRPVFIGQGFGNYDDRLDRSDIRLLLTYVSPRLGYEGPVVLDVLADTPTYRILTTFPVQETPADDVAALIEK